MTVTWGEFKGLSDDEKDKVLDKGYGEVRGECYICGKEVDLFGYCFGCGELFCEDCPESVVLGQHSPGDHKD